MVRPLTEIMSSGSVPHDSKTSRKKFLAIAGPTASGKSSLALALAEGLAGEIVSCDSVQVYRGFDVGAAKPTAAERDRVPHHLVDCCAWHEDFDAARFASEARAVIEQVQARGRLPIVVGGTGLYLRALFGAGFHPDLPRSDELREELRALAPEELLTRLRARDPERAAAIHPNDSVRLVRALELSLATGKTAAERNAQPLADDWRVACQLIVLDPPRAELHQRIAVRTEQMLNEGLIEEVRGLLAAGVDPACKPMQSIGYKQVVTALAEAGTEGAAERERLRTAVQAKILAATRQYAKRQVTWFKSVQPDMRLEQGRAVELLPELRRILAL